MQSNEAAPGFGDDTSCEDILGAATAKLPGGGEDRPGQKLMANAVFQAIRQDHHIAVQAGTGTGKSLAYLIPAIASNKKVVIATATKALQDQLANKDLPFLKRALNKNFTFSLLKGRSNYICLQKLREVSGRDIDKAPTQLGLAEGLDERLDDPDSDLELYGFEDQLSNRNFVDDLKALIAWGETTLKGDIAEFLREPNSRAWAALSTTSQECPGANECPSGSVCFAEAAKHRSSSSDLVITNIHLYCSHLASETGVLPKHDIVIFDEAHQLEDIASSSFGVELSANHIRNFARSLKPLLGKDKAEGEADLVDSLDKLADDFERRSSQLPRETGVVALDELLVDCLNSIRQTLSGAIGALSRAVQELESNPSLTADKYQLKKTRIVRATQVAFSLDDNLSRFLTSTKGDVIWTKEISNTTILNLAPIDIRHTLASRLFENTTSVLTSATLPQAIVSRLGLVSVGVGVGVGVGDGGGVGVGVGVGDGGGGGVGVGVGDGGGGGDEQESTGVDMDRANTLNVRYLDVGSPFPYPTNSLLYCAAHLPEPKHPTYADKMHKELVDLLIVSRGRALVLFTSWSQMNSTLEYVQGKVDYEIYVQGRLSKTELMNRFSNNESSCLFATMSFWQGIDVPGPALSLVVIDKLPFPRPDDPLITARRNSEGAGAFRKIDLPRCATLLAQGAGRLIRSSQDTGVVAVLDSRLAKATYRNVLLKTLPPMKRTISKDEVATFMEERCR